MLTMLQQPGVKRKQYGFLAMCIFQYGINIGSPQQEERALIDAACMEEVYGLLAERLERRAEAALPEGSRCGLSQ
jgi:DNA polymerase III epsilon subunit-like protein